MFIINDMPLLRSLIFNDDNQAINILLLRSYAKLSLLSRVSSENFLSFRLDAAARGEVHSA